MRLIRLPNVSTAVPFAVFGMLGVFAGCVTQPPVSAHYTSQTLVLETTNRGEPVRIVASINVPKNVDAPVPVIVTQHGSSRDGMVFAGGEGRTDEFSTRLINEGTRRGFAVAALDAFYATSIQPTDKRKFPNATVYAVDLKTVLENDKRFDPANLFYTGFSFGAAQVNRSFDVDVDFKGAPWRAVAAVEPGCNIVSEPVMQPFPILIVKGSKSHYHVKPCRYFEKLLKASGNTVSFIVIDGANHFFSANGTITKGVAVNGCFDNPVIRKINGTMVFADGAPATRELVSERCVTDQAGAGKDRKYLDRVVSDVLDFFDANTLHRNAP